MNIFSQFTWLFVTIRERYNYFKPWQHNRSDHKNILKKICIIHEVKFFALNHMTIYGIAFNDAQIEEETM